MPQLNLNLWFGSGFLLYTKMSYTYFDHLDLLVFPYSKYVCLGNKEIHKHSNYSLLHLSTTVTVASPGTFLLYVSTFSKMVVCKQLCILIIVTTSMSPPSQQTLKAVIDSSITTDTHSHSPFCSKLWPALLSVLICSRPLQHFGLENSFPGMHSYYIHMV